MYAQRLPPLRIDHQDGAKQEQKPTLCSLPELLGASQKAAPILHQPTCHPKVVGLVDDLFTPDWQERVLDKYGYDRRALPPERLTRHCIYYAAKMLACLYFTLPPVRQKSALSEYAFQHFSERFFCIIPHTNIPCWPPPRRIGNEWLSTLLHLYSTGQHSVSLSSVLGPNQLPPLRVPLLDTSTKIKGRLNLLRLLYSLAPQQWLVAAREQSLSQHHCHPIDSLIHQLNVSQLTWLGLSHHQGNKDNDHAAITDLIEHYIEGSRRHREFTFGLEVLSVFGVECQHVAQYEYHYQQQETAASPAWVAWTAAIKAEANTRLLWHGTPVVNVASILRNGFALPSGDPLVSSHGASFGPGIYFTDCASKAAQYCGVTLDARRHTAYLLLCEVSLGQMLALDKPTIDPMERMTQAKKHSIHGRGYFVPDPKARIQDERGIIVPLGNLVECPEEPRPHNVYNEFVVFDPRQVRIRYIVQVLFHF